MKGIRKPCTFMLILLHLLIGILSGCRGDSLESGVSLAGTWQLPPEDSGVINYWVLYEDGSGNITSVFPGGTYLADFQLYWDASEGYLTLRAICPFTGVITNETSFGYELRNGELVLNYLEDDGSVAETFILPRIPYYLEPPYFRD